jgi:hypothetical protein
MSPSGFRKSLPSFASSLLAAMPQVAGNHLRGFQVSLIDRDLLHDHAGRRDQPEDFPRLVPVVVHPGADEHAVRAQAAGRPAGQGGADAELAGFVAGRAHDPALVRRCADDHWPAPQFRPVALLDRRVEGVHVEMQDHAAGRRGRGGRRW